jgi:SAM-dependent methyltransferase
MATPEEARGFPRGSIRLGVCTTCGFIANTAYDPSLRAYSEAYEETQGFSPRFQAFARELAERLIERYDLRGKSILEIGCGKGEFLALVCELGDNRGIGIDPAIVLERIERQAGRRITFIQDYYSERYAHLVGDLVLCRHTLEHIPDTERFLRLIRSSLGSRRDVVVCFEVPDVARVLREVAFWDVYYEHCSYFTTDSLAGLFRRTGFEVLDETYEFDDQYLVIEARAGEEPNGNDGSRDAAAAVVAAALDYGQRLPGRLEGWRRQVSEVVEAGGRVALWGSGSKGVAFLTSLGFEWEIEDVVDVNPFRQGKFMVGTGQQIVPPDALQALRPDLVIAMNPIYLTEIQSSLDALGVGARLVAV